MYTTNSSHTSRPKFIFLGLFSLLILPIIGMMVSDEVQWDLFDFLVGGVVLGVFGLALELAFRFSEGSINRRIVLIAGVVLFFVLLWAELAVGIFGSPIAGS